MNPFPPGNLFDYPPADATAELFTTIFQNGSLRIERIVSRGQSSPPGFWYDQDKSEWIIVLEGSAILEFEGQAEPLALRRGSHVNIPAHTRHRVAWTDPEQTTIWLAVHYND